MIVAHNVSAINTYNQMNKTISVSNKSMEKLSSGYRINRAADDAAGLSISEKMRAQIRGLNQASENAFQGISYLQVADGALNEIDSMLHRIRELAINSANGIYKEFSEYKKGEIKLDETDRAMLDREVQQLKSEMDRIFETTEYNTMKIWTPPQGKYIDHISVADKKTETSPTIVWTSITNKSNATNINKEAAGASAKFVTTENGFKFTWTGYNGRNYESKEIPFKDGLAGSYEFKMSDYMDYDLYPDAIGLDGTFKFSIDSKATKEDVINNLNNKGISTSSYVYISPQLKFETGNESTNKIWIDSYSGRFSSSEDEDYFSYSSILVTEKDFDAVDNNFITPTNSGDNLVVNPCVTKNANDKFVFTFTMPNIGNVTATSTSINFCSAVNEGPDGGLWWYTNEYLHSPSYNIHYATATNGVSGSYQHLIDALTANPGVPLGNVLTTEHGGYISIQFNVAADSKYTLKNGVQTTSIGNFYLTVKVNPEDTLEDVVNKIANIKGLDFNDLSNHNETTYFNLYNTSSGNSSKTTFSYAHDYELVSYEDIHLLVHVGPNANQTIDLKHKTLRLKTIGLENTNILTRKDANNAIGEVIKALDIINAERSNFGALQNRLEHTIESLNSTSENMQNAESIIRDTDMAEEMMSEVKSSILQQASQAMLTQAMQRPQQVLDLLRQ